MGTSWYFRKECSRIYGEKREGGERIQHHPHLPCLSLSLPNAFNLGLLLFLFSSMHCRYFIIARIACPVSLAQHWNISPSSPCSSAASRMIMTLFKAAGIPLSRNSRVCLIQPFPVAIVLMNVFAESLSFFLSPFWLFPENGLPEVPPITLFLFLVLPLPPPPTFLFKQQRKNY